MMKLFIPRLGANVTFEILDSVFNNLGIGHVYSADFKKKGYGKRAYQYAFIEVVPFLNSISCAEFQQHIYNTHINMAFIEFTDKKEKWVVRPHKDDMVKTCSILRTVADVSSALPPILHPPLPPLPAVPNLPLLNKKHDREYDECPPVVQCVYQSLNL